MLLQVISSSGGATCSRSCVKIFPRALCMYWWHAKARLRLCSGMGINASNLQLTNFEDLPPDILRLCIEKLTGPHDDGTSLLKVSRVCRAWKRIAGTGMQGSSLAYFVVSAFLLCRRACKNPEDKLCRFPNRHLNSVPAVPKCSTAEHHWGSQTQFSCAVWCASQFARAEAAP